MTFVETVRGGALPRADPHPAKAPAFPYTLARPAPSSRCPILEPSNVSAQSWQSPFCPPCFWQACPPHVLLNEGRANPSTGRGPREWTWTGMRADGMPVI